jgi:hypothetical protein
METSPQNKQENKSGQLAQPQSSQYQEEETEQQLAVTLQQQLQMVKEWENQNGGKQLFRIATRVLEKGTLLTKKLFLNLLGIGGLAVEDAMEMIEDLVEDETLPDYFPRLPE